MSDDLKYSPWEIGHAQMFACTSGIAHVIDSVAREFHDARKYRVTYVCGKVPNYFICVEHTTGFHHRTILRPGRRRCRKCTAEMERRSSALRVPSSALP